METIINYFKNGNKVNIIYFTHGEAVHGFYEKNLFYFEKFNGLVIGSVRRDENKYFTHISNLDSRYIGIFVKEGLLYENRLFVKRKTIINHMSLSKTPEIFYAIDSIGRYLINNYNYQINLKNKDDLIKIIKNNTHIFEIGDNKSKELSSINDNMQKVGQVKKIPNMEKVKYEIDGIIYEGIVNKKGNFLFNNYKGTNEYVDKIQVFIYGKLYSFGISYYYINKFEKIIESVEIPKENIIPKWEIPKLETDSDWIRDFNYLKTLDFKNIEYKVHLIVRDENDYVTQIKDFLTYNKQTDAYFVGLVYIGSSLCPSSGFVKIKILDAIHKNTLHELLGLKDNREEKIVNKLLQNNKILVETNKNMFENSDSIISIDKASTDKFLPSPIILKSKEPKNKIILTLKNK